MKHADACERSSPFNASAPVIFISRVYRFCFYMLCFLFKLQVDGMTRDDRIRCMYDVSDSILIQ